MAFTQIVVTHSFKNIDSTPASGVIVFRLSARVTNSGVSYAPQVPVHATLDSAGNLSVTLPANNDPATSPQNSTYQVTFMVNGAAMTSDEYSITVPFNAPGGTVDLGTLLPQQVGA